MKSIIKRIILRILKLEAKLILSRFKPKIIAITGTAGKTSTKEAIALVLRENFRVRKSEKSYNSEFGVPLTIIGAKTGWDSPGRWIGIISKGLKVLLFSREYPEILVLETGVDRPGDMGDLVSWVKADVAVATVFGSVPVHVQYFDSPGHLIKEKGKLLESLTGNGIAILNEDDKSVISFKKRLKARSMTFGFSDSADLSASNYKINPDGIIFKVSYGGSVAPVKMNLFFGRQNVYVALAAIATGLSCGVNLIRSIEALAKMRPSPGRLNLIEGMNGSLVFDDTYNSSPIAAEAAIETLAEYPAKRRIAVLGDMRELGRYSKGEHLRLGEILRVKDVWFLLAVGEEAKYIAEGARKSGFDEAKIFEFDSAEETGDALAQMIAEGDVILVKGSQGIRLEKLVEKIMAHPEEKEKVLARQEEEWKRR
ncbi:UDP-N-acetylmuramoyl-tripeptide--D-alanyl-D-alanine ligase [Candidatus Parcubacteria bacterium]|nr:MAG: UDP-N-acetylmuramoyl-tripeptide--D-alanyl-D-alanine ligase [Candidatus Parcubacteria bacterium]